MIFFQEWTLAPAALRSALCVVTFLFGGLLFFAFFTFALFPFFPFILAIFFVFALLSFLALLVEIILFFLNVLLLVLGSLGLLDSLGDFLSRSLLGSAHFDWEVIGW